MEVKVKSLKKALDLLECFTIEKPELGVTELSIITGLYKSNIYNLLSTLESCGYIEQNPMTERYRLGTKILKLSHVIATAMPENASIRQAMSEMAKEINEMIYFGIADGDAVLYLENVLPEIAYTFRPIRGMTAPLYCTGLGKAMLAYFPSQQIEKILAQPHPSFTENTITDADQLRKEFAEIRRCGYSIDNMEHEYGIKCVGVPLFNQHGELVGAFSATGPSLRFSTETCIHYAEILQEKAKSLHI